MNLIESAVNKAKILINPEPRDKTTTQLFEATEKKRKRRVREIYNTYGNKKFVLVNWGDDLGENLDTKCIYLLGKICTQKGTWVRIFEVLCRNKEKMVKKTVKDL